MTKRQIVLAAMAPADGDPHSPVQMQKLLFLLDREAAKLINGPNGPRFKFEPYHYGPFDRDIYKVLEKLDADGLVTVRSDGWKRMYALTPKGQKQGDGLFDKLSKPARQYIQDSSSFVRKLDFMQLVSSIYQKYPDMRVNSVLRPSASQT